MMDEKKNKVVEAALKAFMHYGYKRVTMGDIARSAGISRPALYLVFCNKEEIFKATLANFSAKAVEQIRAELPGHASVSEKLNAIFEIWTIRPFELVHDAPDAKELTECTYGFAADVMAEAYDRFEDVLAGVLEPDVQALADHDLTPRQVAHVMAIAARGFKESARDVNELRALVAGLIGMTTAALCH